MMQSGDSAGHHYGHPGVPMDLHMPQPFSYYSCIMDNNAMFAAQQNAVYGKMYGSLDATGRTDELGAQSTINTRILELRKEKSRDAARSRRGKENHEYYELAKMLPLPGAITSQLDKASIIRLTISYLRLRDFAAQGDPGWTKETSQQQRLKTANAFRSNAQTMAAMEMFEEHEGTHILQSLDGFAISLNSDGRFLYISETVSIYLGLSQVELTGSSVFDYVHQSDHLELAEQLGVNLAHQQRLSSSSSSHHSSPMHGTTGAGSNNLGETVSSGQHQGGIPTGGQSPAIPDVCYPVTSLMHARVDRNSGKPTYDRAFCIRMKSTLTKRGCHFKSSGYRVVLLLGRLRPANANNKSCYDNSKVKSNSSGNNQSQSSSSTASSNQHHSSASGLAPGSSRQSSVMGFIGVAVALPPPSVHEVRLESDMFVTRLSFDFKIAHCEPKVSELLDYTADDLTGQSLYALCHGEDVHKMKKTHEDLLNKGQVMSNYYRMMNKQGGYSWMQSCATLICNTKNSDEQSIICVNYVLSGPQFSNIIMDHCQMPESGKVTGGVLIKEDCKCDYAEAGEKCDIHDKKGNLKRQYQTLNEVPDGRNNHSSDNAPDISGHVPGSNDGNVPGSAFHINPNENMGQERLGQQGNYHVTNTTNKEWPFWRPPTLI